MYNLLFETIKIEDGRIYNLKYHQNRFNKSRRDIFGKEDIIHLFINIKAPKKGLFRCRILYADKIYKIEYIPYKAKKINSLEVISSNIDYSYKYAYRDELKQLLFSSSSDDIIIEKNGYITDTTIANIAFYDGENWITPKKPLLEGTMRAKLLDEGSLILKNITKDDLFKYSQVALINAMIGFKILNQYEVKL